MKKAHISNFIIKFFLLAGVNFHLLAQETAGAVEKTPITEQRYGPVIGIDLVSASRNLWDNNFKGFDATIDYRINASMYIVADLGYTSLKTIDERLTYKTKGSFLKLGLNKNYHKNWLGLSNQIYAGARYGLSFLNQDLQSYKILSQGGYLPEYEVLTDAKSGGLNAHWLEFVLGMKAEIFRNLYLGYAFRLHYMLYQKPPDNFENLYIPGFGRKNSNHFGASFQYYLSYFIPLKTKKITTNAVDLEAKKSNK